MKIFNFFIVFSFHFLTIAGKSIFKDMFITKISCENKEGKVQALQQEVQAVHIAIESR